MDADADAAELRRSAGEILNGVRRRVQVQVIGGAPSAATDAAHFLPSSSDGQLLLMDAAFLNPVSREQVAHECGLHEPTAAESRLMGGYHTTSSWPLDGVPSSRQQRTGGHEHHHHLHHHHELYLGDIAGQTTSYASHPADIQPAYGNASTVDDQPMHHPQHPGLSHLHHHQLHQHQHGQHHMSASALADEVEVLFADDFNLGYFGFMPPPTTVTAMTTSGASGGVAGNLMA